MSDMDEGLESPMENERLYSSDSDSPERNSNSSSESVDNDGSPPYGHGVYFPPLLGNALTRSSSSSSSSTSSSSSSSDSTTTNSSEEARHGSEPELWNSDDDLESLHLEDEEDENQLTSEAEDSGHGSPSSSITSEEEDQDQEDQAPPAVNIDGDEGEEENPVLPEIDFESSKPSPELELDSKKEEEKERQVMKIVQRNYGRSSSLPDLASTSTSTILKSPSVPRTDQETSCSTRTLKVDCKDKSSSTEETSALNGIGIPPCLKSDLDTQTREISLVISTIHDSSSKIPDVDPGPCPSSPEQEDDEKPVKDRLEIERNFYQSSSSSCLKPCSTSSMNVQKLRSVRFAGLEFSSPPTKMSETKDDDGQSVVDGEKRTCTREEFLKTISLESYSDCGAKSDSEDFMQIHHNADFGADGDELTAATGVGKAPFSEKNSKDIPCKFHDGISGKCWKGDWCVYGHELHTGGIYEKHNPVLAFAASSKAGASTVSNIFSKPVLNVGAEICGYITYVKDPSEFYVRLYEATPTAHECTCSNAWSWLKAEKPDVETYMAGLEFPSKTAEDKMDAYFYGFNLIEIPEGFGDNPSPKDIPKVKVKLIEDHLHDALALGMQYRSFQKNDYQLHSEIVAVRMEGRWRRAVVLMEHTKLAKDAVRVYNVRCIDTGNILTVDSRNMCRLPERFGIVPAQAYRCLLHGVSPNLPGVWSDDAIEEFKKLVYLRKVRIMVMKGLKDENDVSFGILERRPYFVKVFVDEKEKTMDLTRVMIDGDYGVEWSTDPKFPFVIQPGMATSAKFDDLIQEWNQKCQIANELEESEKMEKKSSESKAPGFKELTDPRLKKLELKQKKKKLKIQMKSKAKKQGKTLF